MAGRTPAAIPCGFMQIHFSDTTRSPVAGRGRLLAPAGSAAPERGRLCNWKNRSALPPAPRGRLRPDRLSAKLAGRLLRVDQRKKKIEGPDGFIKQVGNDARIAAKAAAFSSAAQNRGAGVDAGCSFLPDILPMRGAFLGAGLKPGLGRLDARQIGFIEREDFEVLFRVRLVDLADAGCLGPLAAAQN